MKKICLHCHSTFECNAAYISKCFCNKMLIPQPVQEILTSKYSNCLCESCILDFINQYNVDKQL
ncbi:MAG: cysteine-rich CWC family protein [Chitinophagales bacterium]|nr:cysteine-rich CWC family protein [Chitinophagales bacterium]